MVGAGEVTGLAIGLLGLYSKIVGVGPVVVPGDGRLFPPFLSVPTNSHLSRIVGVDANGCPCGEDGRVGGGATPGIDGRTLPMSLTL